MVDQRAGKIQRSSIMNREKQMAKNVARQDLDRQKMREIGRVLGFFSAYSELQTGIATYHMEYDAASLCNPKVLGDPRLLKKSEGYLDPHALYLKEDDCHTLYIEGWNEGHAQGVQAYETDNLELIGEIARLAGRLAPFYTAYTTAENDARDCKVAGEARIHFIVNWRQTGGDRRRRKGV
jgi:hypothetical protein